MKKIVLFDTEQGTQNLGDYIIMEAIMEEMKDVFEGNFLTHFSTHMPIARFYQNFRRNMASRACDSADYKFICGTNIIKYSLLRLAPDWNINYFNCKYYKNSIAIGCGSDTNAKKMDIYTKAMYKKIFSKEYIHSVRDERTKRLLESIGVKAINTGCPTLWGFTPELCKEIPHKKADKVVFTLTFYNKDLEVDQKLINILNKNYKEIYFWVQGSEDLEYLNSFNGIENIKIVNPTLEAYKDLLEKGDIDYVGTRLHAGIYAMKHKVRSIILAIDNRARDMSETYNINTIDKKNVEEVEVKINSEFETNININKENIKKWKEQFKK